jgi:hypothetical protein
MKARRGPRDSGAVNVGAKKNTNSIGCGVWTLQSCFRSGCNSLITTGHLMFRQVAIVSSTSTRRLLDLIVSPSKAIVSGADFISW